MLKAAIPYKPTSKGLVAVDRSTGEFVVLRPHIGSRFHAYAKTWDQLSQEQRNALIRAKLVTQNGKIL
jgi:hypothetical protein